MGKLDLDFLKLPEKQKGAMYRDMHFDLEIDYKTESNVSKAENLQNDVKVSEDLEAINNSLTCIFSTYPGERLLNIEYGSNLNQVIFEPISEYTAEKVGNILKEAVERWEPRVQVDLFEVFPDMEHGEYHIKFHYTVPSIHTKNSITGIIPQADRFKRG